MRVLAIPGSLRTGSLNGCLLRLAAERAPAGMEVDGWEGLRAVPPYDEDDDVEPAPFAVRALRDAIAGADALLFATPEYNSSIPGVLKNAVDWASRPRAETVLAGKPVAVIGATTGSFGADWAQDELRKVLGSAGARVLDEGLAVPRAHEAFDEHGRPLRPELAEGLDGVLEALASEVARGRTPAAVAA